MKSKNVRRSLLTIVLAFVIVLGGVVAVPEKASAAVTDTVLKWPTKNKVVTIFLSYKQQGSSRCGYSRNIE